MATILAHITIRSGQEVAFEQLAAKMFDATHAEESGVRAYQYWRSASPRQYYALLAFTDHQAFITHQASDHHEGSSSALRATIEDIRLEWVDPVAGASPWSATNHQQAPDGASDLVRRYTDLYAAEIAPWWAPLRT